jgi:apolipoprotein N-acyltransferase
MVFLVIFLLITTLQSLSFIVSYHFIKNNKFFLIPLLITIIDRFIVYIIGFFSYGYFATNFKIIRQIVSLTGIAGLTFLIISVNLIIAKTIFDLITKNNIKYKPVLVLLMVFILVFIYGFNHIESLSEKLEDTKHYKVGMIQPIYTSQEKNEYKKVFEHVDYQAKMSRTIKNDIDLLMWPETAVNGYDYKFSNDKTLINLAKEKKLDFIVGYKDWLLKSDNPANAVHFYNKKGKLKGRYFKNKLVPLYEYIPYKSFFENKIKGTKFSLFLKENARMIYDTIEFPSFIPFDTKNVFQTSTGTIGTRICYEGNFPSLFRKQTQNGAEILTIASSDAMFGNDSNIQYIDFNTNILRAVENGRYLLRNDNYGISGIINPVGKVIKKTGVNEKTTLVGQYSAIKKKTIYSKYGEWFFILNAGLLVFFYIYNKQKNY